MSYFSDLAEVCGIHAGDGYLRNDNEGRVELDISGGFEEEPYYENHVIPLFSRVFRIKIEGRFFPHRRTYGFVIRNKKIVEKMHELGFPYGAKSKIVRVPKFIMESKNKKIKYAFLRGLFDTDGCLSFERRKGTLEGICTTNCNWYPKLNVSTVSNNLFVDLKTVLNDLKIQHNANITKTKPKNWGNRYEIWMRGRVLLKEWMQRIGVKNYSKLSRYEIWKKFGHCPPKTTLPERLSILCGDIKIHGPVA